MKKGIPEAGFKSARWALLLLLLLFASAFVATRAKQPLPGTATEEESFANQNGGKLPGFLPDLMNGFGQCGIN